MHLLILLLGVLLLAASAHAAYLDSAPFAPGSVDDPEAKDFGFNSTSLPLITSDPRAFTAVFSTRSDPVQSYNLYWKVESGDRLRVAMILNSPDKREAVDLYYAWMGVGFGSTMLNANFVVCHLTQRGPLVKIHRHAEVDGYYASASLEDSAPVERLNGGFANNSTAFFCEWRIPLSAIPSFRNDSLIWAYTPRNQYNTAVR
ncbi:hypothetical protein HDU67_000264, partial [Dinochytrium kinnereticum]